MRKGPFASHFCCNVVPGILDETSSERNAYSDNVIGAQNERLVNATATIEVVMSTEEELLASKLSVTNTLNMKHVKTLHMLWQKPSTIAPLKKILDLSLGLAAALLAFISRISPVSALPIQDAHETPIQAKAKLTMDIVWATGGTAALCILYMMKYLGGTKVETKFSLYLMAVTSFLAQGFEGDERYSLVFRTT